MSDPDPIQRPASRDLRPLRWLGRFLRPYAGTVAGALTALIVAAAATLSLPVAVRFMIDRGFSKDNPGDIDSYFLGLAGIAVIMALATALRHYLVSWLGERVVADIRKAVYTRILHLSPVFFETMRTGEVLSRLTTDTTLIQTAIGSVVSIALRSLFMFSGAVVMLAISAPGLVGSILVVLPFIVLPIIVYARRVRRLARTNQDRIAEASAQAGETLAAMQTIQAFTQEGEQSLRFAGAVESAFLAARRQIRARSVLTALSILLVFGAIVILLWMGARAVTGGSMSAGQLGQFMLYAVILGSSSAALSEVWGDLQRAAGATERLVELLEAEAQITSPANPRTLPEPAPGTVAFSNVTFAYPSRPDSPALQDFSLAIAAGETVALVGPSGAGKSTVLQLLLRFYDPDTGSIELDGVELREAELLALRARIGIVPQDTVLFAASALENIRYGRPDASDAEIHAAARAALAEDFILELPDGYDSYLGERGVRLSGGQRQRIAIARAVLKDPPLLLLDEATSSLDAASERAVQEAIEHLMRGRTTLVIAHRLATVLRADRIVVLDRGRIVATGPHEELVAEDGLYARLAQLQFAA